ncbi:hypothetical protein SDC9_85149 [bioreactor metagenome]|uniref:CDP-diacylglycerol--glycerol-3-phosphate 3-phosphatidyltransferase n=1 Tax=bioreactor metagenome TaxID=1076179 RepID=A0A644ZCA9_9ZZZZ
MKQLPNLITAVRIVLAAALLFVPPLGAAFTIIYLLCALSHFLDGFLARRFHLESELGARLDAWADFIFFAVMILILYPIIAPSTGILLRLAGIAVIRLCAAFISYLRHGVFSFVHTYFNKFTGAVLLLYPLTLIFTRSSVVLSILCGIAALSAAEELVISLTSRAWDANRKSILIKEK